MAGKPAARLTDMHTCSAWNGHTPHVGGPVVGPCAPTVRIGGRLAARVGDHLVCAGPVDTIASGSSNVRICGQRAARLGDWTAHGGVIVFGHATVLIGNTNASGKGLSLNDAAKSGNMGKFEAAFEQMLGMTVRQSMGLYKSESGKDIDEETIRTLFSDSKKARAILMDDASINLTYREILNRNVPNTEQDAIRAGYTKLDWWRSLFHDPIENNKYVGPDGHIEAVYDKDGNQVRSGFTKETFNFFGPDHAEDHTNTDIYPWIRHGFE